MTKHRKRSTGGRRYLGRGGGALPAPSPSLYSSGSQYGTVVSGSPQSQFARTFENGPTSGMGQSNALTGVQGQLSVRAPQKGGRSRRKRGGLLGPVLNQAIVPFGILALQQSYGRRGNNGTKKYYKRNSRRRRSNRRY